VRRTGITGEQSGRTGRSRRASWGVFGWAAAGLDADVHNYLSDYLLVKMDVATMPYSTGARSPLLDHKLIEFMARVPGNMKLRDEESKYLLKSALRRILPEGIPSRRKMGSGLPLGRWLRGGLREMLVGTVLSDTALARGYFRPAVVSEMVETL